MAERVTTRRRVRATVGKWWRAAGLVLAGLTLYGAGGATGWAVATANGGREPTDARGVAPLFWQAWGLAESHYVDVAALKPEKMIYGAIQGMLMSLGDTDHTRFLTPAEVQQEDAMLSGHFVGIGIRINIKDGRPVILAPLPNSPAEQAGLKSGDVILAVNGKDTAQLTLTQLSAEIRGPAGSGVTLMILRPSDNKTLRVTIKRAAIVEPAVDAHQFAVNGKQLLHVHIADFSANADSQLRSALQSAQKAHMDALILDLRDNPGGLLDQAVDVSSEFLTSGNVLLEEGRNGVKHPDPVKSGGVATGVPMVVLINQGTASAAEITAGALKDHGRGPLVGVTTFGTGTVLTSYSLQDGSELLLGTEEWLTPDGNLIWHHGISPTQEVQLPATTNPLFPDAETDRSGDEILHAGDSQLSKAIQDLSS